MQFQQQVNPKHISRRACLSLLGIAATASAAPQWPESLRRRISGWLETGRRPEGGYGWSSDWTPQVTPTFGAVGAYQILGLRPPDAGSVAAFVTNNYPVPEIRRTERPLWRLDFEQVQTLLWLGEPVDSFRPLAARWTQPAEFTTRYEMGGNPVFQHQAMAVRLRHLLNLSPSPDDQPWREYFRARRRPDGTYNSTPAMDGSGGHVMNTLWGLLAEGALASEFIPAREIADWVRNCQLGSGGFTYSPDVGHGAVDDIVYTRCALHILALLGSQPVNKERCAAWIESLATVEGGFQDRPGGEPNPLATYYALDSLRLLGHTPRESVRRAPRALHHPLPEKARVYTIQIQAPGAGSPHDAVLLAKSLGIHIWTAKNSPAGWIAEAQRLADTSRVPVRFAIGNEEYGTYFDVAGHGCYSHLSDPIAPHGTDSGRQLPLLNHPYPWQEFRDSRIVPLRRGGGRMIWQFLENEELTRILLDEAVEHGTYSAISSFHFGNENFLHSQPFLHRWQGRLPFVGLQDAHGQESWWWGDQLSGFTTLFVAEDPSWDSWLRALERNHVMAVRHDAVTGWKTHLAGGLPPLRDFVMKRQREWRWWDDDGHPNRRPLASLVALRPGMLFEEGTPDEGTVLRLRLWQDNTGRGVPRTARAELLRLLVDGVPVEPRLHESPNDRFFLHALPASPGAHEAEAQVRVLESGRVATVSTSWEES